MKSYEEYFSDEALIECLCRIRLNRAAAIHERRFYRKVFELMPESDHTELNELFPPRRAWHRFRPRKERREETSQHAFSALRKCIDWHRRNATEQPWVVRLNQFLEELRNEVLREKSFVFSQPRIVPQAKKGKDEFRAIASFPNVKDKMIDIINAKYLREHLEPCLEDACRAFRSGKKRYLDRNSAINDIYKIREKFPDAPLYVTECDIRGFFDCVHHQVAQQALKRAIDLLAVRNPGVQIDSRSILYFQRYLNSYSFSKVALGYEKRLQAQTKNPNARFKWPVSENRSTNSPNTLNFFHKDPRRCQIGVPQGGAHSCLIANLILDLADKEVCLSLQASEGDSVYLRYCDDIIIITSNENACEKATQAYYRALRAVKLPYHLPTSLNGSPRQFFEDSKTKECYRWGASAPQEGQFPWIQFLGYQIRHDGHIRIRPSSIKKQKDKIGNLGESLRSELKHRKAKVSSKRLMYRFNSKLWAFSSGRVQLHVVHNKPLPMCWASGFKQLVDRPFSPGHVRALDQFAGKERRRLKRFLRKSSMGKSAETKGRRNLSYFGKPFSHLRQFRKSSKALSNVSSTPAID